jgi:hypothetical protein
MKAMIRSRLGLKALGLCALVVGLMAVSAGVAQAESSGGSWTFLNGATLEVLPNNQTIGGAFEPSTDGTLLSTIAKKELEFLCTAFTVTEGKLITGGTVLGSLTFSGCTTKIGKVTQASCEPNAKGIHPGVIETLKIKGTLLLHKLTGGTIHKVIIAEPDEGSAFLHMELGVKCSIGEDVLVGGKLALWDPAQGGSTHKGSQLITEFVPLTHLWVISDTVEHAAHLDGSANVSLTTINVGKSWAALWN